MTATTIAHRQNRHWEHRDYHRIIAARYRHPTLVVVFADGTEAHVRAEELFDNAYIQAQRPDWSRVQAGAHEVLVPGVDEEIGIPWDTFRLLTDPEYAAFWDERIAEVARDLGRRFRELREERGISVHDLATRAGVALRVVENVESGHHDGDFRVTDRLLAAMDLDRDALIAADDAGEAGEADDEADETEGGSQSPG